MPNVKFSELPAVAEIMEADIVPVVQEGVNKKALFSDIRDAIGEGPAGPEGPPGPIRPEPFYGHGEVSGTVDLSLDAGRVHHLVLVGNVVLTFSGTFAIDESYSFTTFIEQDVTGSRLVTWPSIKWHLGAVPSLSPEPNATDVFTFDTFDAGVTWYGWMTGKRMA